MAASVQKITAKSNAGFSGNIPSQQHHAIASDVLWTVSAIHDLSYEQNSEQEIVWVATGEDPQFKIARSDGQKISGGWYFISAEVKFHEAFLQNPCIYPAYHGALDDQHKLNLQVSNPADWNAPSLILLSHEADYLRFDPSDNQCKFSLKNLKIERVNKLQAAKFLFKRLWDRSLGKRKKLALLTEMLPLLLSLKFRALGERLWSSYVGSTLNDYSRWVQAYDSQDLNQLRQEAIDAKNLAYQPLLSILMPVYNTDEVWLKKCIDSILAQTYQHWELCIADDASTKKHVHKNLSHYAAQDARIKVTYREKNGHISAASNSALSMALGEFVVLVDHDDEIPSCALFEVAKALNQNKNLKLIYSDEDKIDREGRRFSPYFKPDWNYELLLSQNFVSHLGVYSRDLVNAVEGFREGFEGSQDHDLALRCIEKLAPDEIGHIAKILYHWRAIPGSTALGLQEKSYAAKAAIKAVDEHLKRIGVKAAVEGVVGRDGTYRVRYTLEEKPLISIIIPTKDKIDVLRVAIGSIQKISTYANYEILIIDNQSALAETKDYLSKISKQDNVHVFTFDQAFNYSAINNFAVTKAKGSVLLLLNNDVEVINARWIEELLSTALHKGVGAVGAMLYYPNNTIQHAGIILGFNGIAVNAYSESPRGHHGQIGRARLKQSMSAVTGACLMVKKSIYEEVGGMDENLAVAFNDVDFCLKLLSKGYRNVWNPFVELIHHESLTRGPEDTPEKRKRFIAEIEYMQNKWRDILDADPAYNRNLSLSGVQFALAFPPRLKNSAYTKPLWPMMENF
jgi:O-antigen biosynthesis protein